MRRLLSIALALAVATPLAAQDQPASGETTRNIGFGVQVTAGLVFFDFDVPLFPASGILVPIRVNPKFTLEPEVSLMRFSNEFGGATSSVSQTRLGVGFLGEIGAQENALHPYIGLRVGMTRITEEEPSGPSTTTTTKTTGWTIAGVVGGQHFFSPGFSLGGEVQLARTGFGEPKESPAPPFPSGSGKLSIISTTGTVTVRWFP